MTRLDDVLRYQSDPQRAIRWRRRRRRARVQPARPLELRNVTFGYSRLEPPLIENFNLTIRPGDASRWSAARAAASPRSRKLVAGLYEPWEGEVLFDGRPRAEHAARGC